jgi:predicted GIY-YIG superfamily endonuclease
VAGVGFGWRGLAVEVIGGLVMTTFLYRLYNANDELLYIGISKSAIHRLHTHLVHQPWGAQIVKQTVERFEKRSDAIQAETLAIKSEQPKHNIVHNYADSRPQTKWLEIHPASDVVVTSNCHMALRFKQSDPVWRPSQGQRKAVFGLCAEVSAVKNSNLIAFKCSKCHDWETKSWFKFSADQLAEVALLDELFVDTQAHDEVTSLVTAWQRAGDRRAA